jgi:hypothetical protein
VDNHTTKIRFELMKRTKSSPAKNPMASLRTIQNNFSCLDVQENDCKDDENQQLKEQSIENGKLSGMRNLNEEKLILARKAHIYPCKDACKLLPEHPSRWPQRPVMIRPTPHSSTKVIGIVR